MKTYSCLRPAVVLSSIVALLALAAPVSGAVIFATNTLIDTNNIDYDGQDIVISNCSLTANGPHWFSSVLLTNNAVLSHSAAPQGEANHFLNLSIDGDMVVDATSAVDAAELGYESTLGPGSGFWVEADTSGGGYGGAGGIVWCSTNFYKDVYGGGTYGSMTQPRDWGSGGGSYPIDGPSYGGGSIQLSLGGTLRVDGAIRADGGTPDGPEGGASGGGIYLIASAITGAGSISANGGGCGLGSSGGGGGGRIAIYADSTNGFYGTVSATGGVGSGKLRGIVGYDGSEGTIYWSSTPTPAAQPQLVQTDFSGNNFTFYFQSTTNITYTIQYCNDLSLNNWQVYGSIIGNGSKISCVVPANNTAQQFFRLRRP